MKNIIAVHYNFHDAKMYVAIKASEKLKDVKVYYLNTKVLNNNKILECAKYGNKTSKKRATEIFKDLKKHIINNA